MFVKDTQVFSLAGIGQTEGEIVDAVDLALREIIFTQLNHLLWFRLQGIPRKTGEQMD